MRHKHFGRCGNEAVELDRPNWEAGQYVPAGDKWLLVLILDGQDSRSQTRKVRDANLFAVGTCPACGKRHFAERVIARPHVPRNHKCDGRCLSAKGHVCECACGGANHGNS